MLYTTVAKTQAFWLHFLTTLAFIVFASATCSSSTWYSASQFTKPAKSRLERRFSDTFLLVLPHTISKKVRFDVSFRVKDKTFSNNQKVFKQYDSNTMRATQHQTQFDHNQSSQGVKQYQIQPGTNRRHSLFDTFYNICRI